MRDAGIRCHCGGELREIDGPYGTFYGCSNYRGGCRVRLKPAEYQQYAANGVVQIPAKSVQQVWTRTNHRPYHPPQKTNTRPVTVARKRMTDEQEALIVAAMKPGITVLGSADAGVGKTSVLKQVATRVAPFKNEGTAGIIIAFNARPSHELQKELPAGWVAATVHSCGNDACAARYGVDKFKPNKHKTDDIIVAEYGTAASDEEKVFRTVVEELVSICKRLALDETIDDGSIEYWARMYNRELSAEPSRAFAMTRRILELSRSDDGIRRFGHDFDDQIWLPVINNLPVAQYRYVCCDEAQDLNIARMKLALRMLKKGGTLIIVGDKDQSIYGFTCADPTSIDTFVDMSPNDVEQYPITINWRCPQTVIQLTQLIHPSIKARPNAPSGAIHLIEEDDIFDIAKRGDVILCRTNAPLVAAAYHFIKMGIGARVLGREIGEKIERLIRKLAKNGDSFCSTKELIKRAGAWYMAELESIENKNLRNPDAAIQLVTDNYECILAICGVEINEDNTLKGIGIPTVEGIITKIKLMFGDENDIDMSKVILLSTVHKFKGSQAARIFILNAEESHPHPMASSEFDKIQEHDILYVAITRCGDGTTNPNQALFFHNGMPAPLREKGGMSLVTPYIKQ